MADKDNDEKTAPPPEPRITPKTYDYGDKLVFEQDSRHPEDNPKEVNNFLRIKIEKGKKEVSFRPYFSEVEVSNYFLGKYDKYENRTIFMSWGEDNKTTPDVVAFFEKFTADI